ncbi:hypothetical protein KC364_g48 [Hortaea werneckii]|nr:hypothetical protein KC364_g48 [Hortaea werneckii]
MSTALDSTPSQKLRLARYECSSPVLWTVWKITDVLQRSNMMPASPSSSTRGKHVVNGFAIMLVYRGLTTCYVSARASCFSLELLASTCFKHPAVRGSSLLSHETM